MTRQTSWILAVISAAGDDFSTAVLAIEPPDEDTWSSVARRLRQAGWQRPTRQDWSRCIAAVVPTGAVDVVGRKLVRVTTGTASVYADGDIPTSPQWTSAARERRALVVLTKPGAFPNASYSPAEVGEVLNQRVAARQVLAALAPVRFDVFTGKAPVGRRAT